MKTTTLISERAHQLDKFSRPALVKRLLTMNPLGGYMNQVGLTMEQLRDTVLRYEYGPVAWRQWKDTRP